MKRFLKLASIAALATGLGACGGTTDIFGDGGTADMAQAAADMAITLYRLQSGVYHVDGAVTGLTDGCKVDPNGANPVAGLQLALVNDGKGNITLGAYDTGTKMPGANVGMPPQPSNGSSCPGMNNPAECTTEPTAAPFNNNQGWLVRDNNVDDGMGCTFHRHIVNKLTLTADNTFTADYTRKDTNHAGCVTQTMDCTTTWTWKFVYDKQFGQ